MSNHSTPSAIEATEHSNKRKYGSHESFGFRQETPAVDTMAGSPTTHIFPPVPTAIWNPQSNQEPERKRRQNTPGDTHILPSGEELFLSDLAVGDDSQDIDIDPPDYFDDSVDQRPNNTSMIMNNIVQNAIPTSQKRLYTSEPPPGPHWKYINFTDYLDTSMQRFRQVLIWGFTRRIRILATAAKESEESGKDTDPDTYIVTRLLESVREKLETEDIQLKWNMHELLHLRPKLDRYVNHAHEELYQRLVKRRMGHEVSNEEGLAYGIEMAKELREGISTKRLVTKEHISSGERDLETLSTNDNEARSQSHGEIRQNLYAETLSQSVAMTSGVLREILDEVIENDGRVSQLSERLSAKLSKKLERKAL